MPNRRQAIIWTNVSLGCRCICVTRPQWCKDVYEAIRCMGFWKSMLMAKNKHWFPWSLHHLSSLQLMYWCPGGLREYPIIYTAPMSNNHISVFVRMALRGSWVLTGHRTPKWSNWIWLKQNMIIRIYTLYQTHFNSMKCLSQCCQQKIPCV